MNDGQNPENPLKMISRKIPNPRIDLKNNKEAIANDQY